ncbi:MAG: hypothetical protein IJL66_08515 [Lachnospiraceae bacterium]|nr:hypothetical protein [Lachnospiraceae bacterium]
MKKELRKKSILKRIAENTPAPLQYALSKGAVLVGAGVIPILIFEYSPVLGYWWGILLLLYIAALIFIRIRILWPREKAVLLHDLGPEQFYALFPKEKKRDERRQALQEKRAARRERRAERAIRRKERK